MKTLTLIAIILVVPICAYSQFVMESLEGIVKNYRPLFSKEMATVNFDYMRMYNKGKTDTSFTFVVAVSYQIYEEKGVSSSFGYAFGSGGGSAVGVSTNRQFDLTKNVGEYYMTLDTLALFIGIANNIYVHANAKHQYNNIAMDYVGPIGLSVELSKTSALGNTKSYYLSIYDAVFPMTEEAFTQLMMMAIRARDSWKRAIGAE